MICLEHYVVRLALLAPFLIGAEATRNFTSELTMRTPEGSVLVCVSEDPREEPQLQLHLYLSGYDGILDYFGGAATLSSKGSLSPGPHILTYAHGITDRTHDIVVTVDEEDVPFTKPSEKKMWYTSFQFKYVEVHTEGPAVVAALEGEPTVPTSDLVLLCPSPTTVATTTATTTAESESPSTTPVIYNEPSTKAPMENLTPTALKPPAIPLLPTPFTSLSPPVSPTPGTSSLPPSPPTASLPPTLPTASVPPTPPKTQGSITFAYSWLKEEVVVVVCVLAGLVVLCCCFTLLVCVCCKRKKTGTSRNSSKTPKKMATDAEYQKVPLAKV